MAASATYPRSVAPLVITGNAQYQIAPLSQAKGPNDAPSELDIIDRDHARIAALESMERPLIDLLWEGHDAFR